MRASMAYFAGAGTVIAAIVGGVGGGLLIADMISPKSPKGVEMTRLERRMSPEPIQVATAITAIHLAIHIGAGSNREPNSNPEPGKDADGRSRSQTCSSATTRHCGLNASRSSATTARDGAADGA